MSIEYPCVYWSDGMCKKFSDDKSTSWCVEGPCGDQMPSNADKIRDMSDEELVKVLDYEVGCPPAGNCEKMNRTCYACWLNWLQQPAETEEKK